MKGTCSQHFEHFNKKLIGQSAENRHFECMITKLRGKSAENSTL